jgi:hypothetical protein
MRSLHLSESGLAQCGQRPLRSLALLGERILVLLMLLILPALWPAVRAQGQVANSVSSSPSLPTTHRYFNCGALQNRPVVPPESALHISEPASLLNQGPERAHCFFTFSTAG